MTKHFARRSQHFLTKLFSQKTIFFVLCVKKINFGAKIGIARGFFLSFYTRHKNIDFLQNLPPTHRTSRPKSYIFVWNFLMF
jgi:hypothetical protein